jgi:hypothetical protein
VTSERHPTGGAEEQTSDEQVPQPATNPGTPGGEAEEVAGQVFPFKRRTS